MKKQIYIALAILIVLGFAGSVLAFWPFTGKVISGNVVDGTAMNNAPQTCMDSDDGIFALVPGSVTDVAKSKIYKDSCSGSNVKTFYDSNNNPVNGKVAIIEYYCDSNGKVQSQKMTSAELGGGACILSTDADTSGLAYWKTKEKKCIVDPLGFGVIDENGKKWYNGCGTGADKDKLITYTCDGANVVPTPYDCTANGYKKCNIVKKACTGKCEDNDAANDKNTSGIVTTYEKFVNAQNETFTFYPDRCTADKKSVKQFKCDANKNAVSAGVVSCGTGKKCLDNMITGAKCIPQDKAPTIDERVVDLENNVENLLRRVANLECNANPEDPSAECCFYYPTTPGCTAG